MGRSMLRPYNGGGALVVCAAFFYERRTGKSACATKVGGALIATETAFAIEECSARGPN